jgi:hypothetical protein
MFSFCMYCCMERCAAITISIFSTLFLLSAAATVYLTKRLRDESYVWDLQEDPSASVGSANGTSNSSYTAAASLVEAA